MVSSPRARRWASLGLDVIGRAVVPDPSKPEVVVVTDDLARCKRLE